MNNILVIGAHYNDAGLGVGGVSVRMASEGKNVYKLTLDRKKAEMWAEDFYKEYTAAMKCIMNKRKAE